MATENWRAAVAAPAAKVIPVITITPDAGPVLYLSAEPFAYFKADLLRIGEVRQEIDEQAGSIPLPEMTFVHSNAGREFEQLLEGAYDYHGAVAQKAYAVDGLDSADWAVEFTGRVTSWSYGSEGITVTCRHDDGAIRNSSVPNQSIVPEEWGKTDLGYGALTVPSGVGGIRIPLVYGKQDSTDGMGSAGAIPTICVGFNNGTAEYLLCLGEGADIAGNLVVYDLNKAVIPYSYAGIAYRGGKTVSVFGFSYLAPVSEDASFRADMHGYEPVGDGTGTVITNPVAQLKHFAQLVYSSPPYRTGAWPTGVAPLAASAWTAAEAWATAFGIEGAILIGGTTSTEQAKDIFERWLRSFPLFRLYWNATGQLEILVFDPTEWPGYPDTTSRRISTTQIEDYNVEEDDSRVIRSITSAVRLCPADGQSYLGVDVVDMIQRDQAGLSERRDWASSSDRDVTRQQDSRMLRLWRKSTRNHRFTAPFQYADLRPGSWLYMDGQDMPSEDGEGKTRRGWSARALLVKSVAKRPTERKVEIVALDPREAMVSFWTPGCTDFGASDDDNGLAMIHQGTAPACTRAQLGWRWRPGDQSFRNADANRWRITPWGISICGGSGAGGTGVLTFEPPNNTFSQGTPPTYTGWSSSGTIYTGLTDGEYLFDATGYRQSAWPYATAYLYNTAAVAVTNGRKIRVYYKWGDFVGEPMLRLEDTAASKWWDPATKTWGADSTWKTPGAFAANGGSYRLHDWHYELWSHEILVDAHASPTLKLYVGNNSGAGATAYIIGAAGFIVPDTNAGAGARPIRRDFVATLGTSLAQAADLVEIDNATTAPILTSDKGTFSCAILPHWAIGDLDTGSKKVIFRLLSDSGYGGGAAYLEGQVEKLDATTLRIHFLAAQGGATIAATYVDTVAAGTFLGDPVRVGFRWTGAAGEYDLAPYTLDVFVDDTKGTAATCSSTPAAVAAGSKVYLGSRGSSTLAHEFIDAMVSHVECRLFPLSDAEVMRTLLSLVLPARPEVV